MQRNQDRCVPPRHRHGALIAGLLEMVRVIGPKCLMVNHSVRAKGIIKFPNRPVHDIPVQRPFKEAAVNHSGKESRKPDKQ